MRRLFTLLIFVTAAAAAQSAATTSGTAVPERGGSAPIANTPRPTPASDQSDRNPAATACPPVVTAFCLTQAPFYGSPDGAISTATVSAATSGATAILVASAATWAPHQGIGIPSIHYIGSVSSVSGSTLLLSPSLTASVVSGATVLHDESAAFNTALGAVQASALHAGTINLPCLSSAGATAVYNVNGPLRDTSGANAIIPMPRLPNYVGDPTMVTIRGVCGQPGQALHGGAPIIQTAANAGALFGGYDSVAGGGYPPFTHVQLRMENLELLGPNDPGIVLVDARHLLSFQGDHLLVRTQEATLPKNTAGAGILMPEILNGVENEIDDTTIAGFFTDLQVTEHAHIGTLSVENSVNCIRLETGANPTAPSGYQGNAASLDHVWGMNCTNMIAAGIHPMAVRINLANIELAKSYGIYDPGNLLHGTISYLNPYAPHTITVSGGANLQLCNLWTAADCGGAPVAYGMPKVVALNHSGATFPNTWPQRDNVMTIYLDGRSMLPANTDVARISFGKQWQDGSGKAVHPSCIVQGINNGFTYPVFVRLVDLPAGNITLTVGQTPIPGNVTDLLYSVHCDAATER